MSNKPKPKSKKKKEAMPSIALPKSAPSFADIMESVDSYNINREAVMVEERLLTMVLMEYLGREPLEGDWREVTIQHYEGDPTRSEFVHKDNHLGTIVRKTTTSNMYDKDGPVKYTVSFDPAVPKMKGNA